MDNKYLCVMALFDKETNAKFEVIKRNLEVAGLESSSLPPHITLGAYVGLEEKEICNWVEKLCNGTRKFEVNFNHFGLFSLNVSFLAPQASEELISFHNNLHERYENYCGEVGYNYTVKSNNWVPHATIMINEPENTLKALPIISDNFKPFAGQIVSITVCEFSPMREIRSFKLDSMVVRQ